MANRKRLMKLDTKTHTPEKLSYIIKQSKESLLYHFNNENIEGISKAIQAISINMSIKSNSDKVFAIAMENEIFDFILNNMHNSNYFGDIKIEINCLK